MALRRTISQVVLSVEQGEGVGVRVRRSIGRPELKNLDPFLMLDEFKFGAPAGFPDHPHRGFETVTYILPSSKGSAHHEDHKGHKGLLQPGGLQWMTAGRGIVHAEMPVDENEAHGLQLWVNLKKDNKMVEPRYQELPQKDLTTVERDGVKAIIISGEAMGIKSPLYTYNPIHYTHFIMQPGATLDHGPVPDNFTTFLYTIKGKGKVGKEEKSIDAHSTVTFNKDGAVVHVVADAKEGFEFISVSAEPLGEPVVQHGPFVMNTEAEILQTIEDYRRGVNGFEGAAAWASDIGKRSSRG